MGKSDVIVLGADHAGYELKEDIKGYFDEKKIKYIDYGTHSRKSVDYPVYGIKVSSAVDCGKFKKGILFCGTGIGLSIVANRFSNVRAALCHDITTASYSRKHNDANVLVLPGRLIGKGLAREIVEVWLNTKFEAGRHKKRVEKINQIGKCIR